MRRVFSFEHFGSFENLIHNNKKMKKNTQNLLYELKANSKRSCFYCIFLKVVNQSVGLMVLPYVTHDRSASSKLYPKKSRSTAKIFDASETVSDVHSKTATFPLK